MKKFMIWISSKLRSVFSAVSRQGSGSTSRKEDETASATKRDAMIAAAREIMGRQKYCAFITVDSSGQAQIRTVNPFPPETDIIVWFATDSRCRKVREIRNNPQVCLYYADHQNATGYVAVSGRAILINEAAEKMKRKRDYWEKAFPDWKYLILIKIIAEKVDVLNYQRGMLNDSITWRTPSIELENPSAE